MVGGEGSGIQAKEDILQISEVGVARDTVHLYCTLKVDGVEGCVIADSGARYILICRECLDKFPDYLMCEPDIRPVSYGNKPIELLGYIEGKLELRLLKGFSHKIILKEGVCPKVHESCNVLLVVREHLRKELRKLCEANIMKEIEASEWLA
ncbi:hypothetical protein NDU88_003526 [Pleurodeles waltl]|uniref:Uncharacterized protein n=1 Tax=Pleurodeles waltl TaxID=8319 RepID=A0AAV7UCS9_PLEWA|nr:hypothetical protein NDU88_003526 [Pleurodeles waltl]